MAQENEQWLSDGICSMCRRQDYCRKPCKKAVLRRDRIIKEEILNKTGLGDVFKLLQVNPYKYLYINVEGAENEEV